MSCQHLKDTQSAHLRCTTYRAKTAVVVKGEHQRKYQYTVQAEQEICIADLDGGILKGKRRADGETASVADKLLLFCEKEAVVVIEFKGGDYSKAVSQLLETLNYLGEIVPKGWEIHARAVCKTIPVVRPANLETLKKAIRQCKGTFDKASNGMLIEKILQL